MPSQSDGQFVWQAVIHTRADDRIMPTQKLKEGIFPSLEEALEMARKRCDELHGIGYTAEAVPERRTVVSFP